MSITRLQQARQMYAMGQRVAKTLMVQDLGIVVLIWASRAQVVIGARTGNTGRNANRA